jgi:hypothetical protein
MLAIEYSTREFFNMLITVQWEWLLATIILTGKLLTSRLARTAQPRPPRLSEIDGGQTITRNALPVTRNSEQCI